MNRKSLKGLIKTRHFRQRQKERKVTDLDVVKAMMSGELVSNDHGHSYQLGTLKVSVDLENDLLITVHPGDPSKSSSKVLTKEESFRIREIIRTREQNLPEETDEEVFARYVREASVKKL